MRIVSLVPSSTETLIALGADVVACTRYCEQPSLLHVGGTKNPDIAAIVALQPDVVVVDREENRLEDAEALREQGCELFVSDVTSVVGAIDVVAELARLADVATPRLGIPECATPDELSVFVPIWRRPWMSISPSTYGGSILAHLGCRLVTDAVSAPYPEVDLDELGLMAPDAVLVPSEPYEFHDRHLDELQHAAPDADVIRIDGQDLFWWGTRTPAAITRLAEVLTPLGARPRKG